MSELVNNQIQKRESSLMPANLNWIGVRFLDPIGKVFKKGDYYYRAIYPHQASFVERLLSSPALEKMIHAGLMTPQIRSKQQVEGFAFCVKSKAADWAIPPAHWTLVTLKQAAINWLAINLALLESGYQLIDAHHGNYVLGENCNPQWIDLGSIQKDSKNNPKNKPREIRSKKRGAEPPDLYKLLHARILKKKRLCGEFFQRILEMARVTWNEPQKQDFRGNLPECDPIC